MRSREVRKLPPGLQGKSVSSPETESGSLDAQLYPFFYYIMLGWVVLCIFSIHLAYLILSLSFLYVELDERNAVGFEAFKSILDFGGRNDMECGIPFKQKYHLRWKKYFCVCLISFKGTSMCMCAQACVLFSRSNACGHVEKNRTDPVGPKVLPRAWCWYWVFHLAGFQMLDLTRHLRKGSQCGSDQQRKRSRTTGKEAMGVRVEVYSRQCLSCARAWHWWYRTYAGGRAAGPTVGKGSSGQGWGVAKAC